MIEIARNVAGLPSADHEESGSNLASIGGRPTIGEGYHGSFGVNPKYRGALEGAGVCFTATDDDGDPRASSLPDTLSFSARCSSLSLQPCVERCRGSSSPS